MKTGWGFSTQGAVIIGLTHAFFPYMVVTIYMALERMDDSLLEASRSLGGFQVYHFPQGSCSRYLCRECSLES